MEYGLMGALIAVAIIATVTLAGKRVASTMNYIATHLPQSKSGQHESD